jgi:hypothetical protein
MWKYYEFNKKTFFFHLSSNHVKLKFTINHGQTLVCSLRIQNAVLTQTTQISKKIEIFSKKIKIEQIIKFI